MRMNDISCIASKHRNNMLFIKKQSTIDYQQNKLSLMIDILVCFSLNGSSEIESNNKCNKKGANL